MSESKRKNSSKEPDTIASTPKNAVPVLRGKDAVAFERYMRRKPTPIELEYVKECDRIYAMHPV